MAIKVYKCNSCDYSDEFIFSISVEKPVIPEICPKCGIGKLEYTFDGSGISFDVIGGFSYQYGNKRNWQNRVDSDKPY